MKKKINIGIVGIIFLAGLSHCEDYCNATRCSECKQRRENIICMDCRERFYHRFNYTCYNCPDGCLDCSDSKTCSRCDDDHMLNSKKECHKKSKLLIIILIAGGTLALFCISGLVYCCKMKNIGGTETNNNREPGQRDAHLPYVDPATFRPIEINANYNL